MDERAERSVMTDIGICRKNRKKAYFAMSGVTALLFAFSIASWIFSYFASYLFENFHDEMQRGLAAFIGMFGVGRQTAFAASRMFFASPASAELIDIVCVIVTTVIPAAVFAKFCGISPKERFRTDGKMLRGFVYMFFVCQLITTAASGFSQGIYDFLFPAAPDFSAGVSDSFVSPESGIFPFIMRMLCVSVLVPVAEEYAFRGVIFGYLRRYGLAYAVVASAAVFGVAHASPVQAVYAFVFGILSAFLVAVTGNIKTSVLLHSLNNLVTVLAEYSSLFGNEFKFDLVYCIYVALSMALAFYGLYRFFAVDRLQDTFNEKAKEIDGGICEKPGIAQILTFPFVLYLLLYALKTLHRVLM